VRRPAATLAISAVAVSSAAALLGSTASTASSHREAPLIINDPTADNTDTYAFVSPEHPDSVTLIANWYPMQEPAGGPNFYPWATEDQARYNIKIDNNGDAKPDITYEWTFQTHDMRGDVDYGGADGSILYNNGPVTSFYDSTLLFKQTYTLKEIRASGDEKVLVEDGPVAPSLVGDASMPDYQALRDEATIDIEEGKSFVGQADDPFFLDLRVFDLLYGGDLSEVGSDTLDGYNVNSVALQVPIHDLTQADDPVIGVWSTTDRKSMRTQGADGSQDYSGDFVQVSRLGNPLVNELVIPANLKDAFNALAPENDASVAPAVAKVLDPEVSKLLEAIYDIPAKATPRDDLFAIFLTGLNGLNKPMGEVQPAELLRLNTAVPPSEDPKRLGALVGDNAGFPNGRRLADDAVDIALQAVAGAVNVDSKEAGNITGVEIVAPLADGDRVDENDMDFGDEFPYLALPTSGSSTNGGADGDSEATVGGVPASNSDTGFFASAAALVTSQSAALLAGATGAMLLGLVLGGFALINKRRVTTTDRR